MEEQVQQRRRKLEILREMGINPFSNGFEPTHSSLQFGELYQDRSGEELAKVDVTYRLAGRIMAIRLFGKAAFAKIQDRFGSTQLYLEKNRLGEVAFDVFKKCIEVGDIVGVEGTPIKTRTGELTLHAQQLRLLTKSVRPLPEKWHGLKDVEARYRRRYEDLIVNKTVLDVFVLRSTILKYLRNYFDGLGFLEVETPMMQVLAGGATAKPFVTHHNALGLELYLRVAPELFLKRLLVGGLERVYELNRCFRNEGISTQHNPEFTMLEFYQAYATYTDLMTLTENLLAGLAVHLTGSRSFEVGDVHLDLTPPFRRVTIRQAVAECLAVSEEALQDTRQLIELAEGHGVQVDKRWPTGKLLMALFEDKVEPGLLQPTFVHDFPLEVSPLSRKKADQPDLVDRFELYICGRELANAFSELNDPDDQRERFSAQMEAKAQGDEEAMPYDEDYIRALEIGMPPAAGQGIGIDRLVMLFANVPSIREVILFPLLRPE